LQYFWSKVAEKFTKLSDAFGYFDLHKRGKITGAQFRFIVEKLQIKLTKEEVTSLFDYIDKVSINFIEIF
jgi:Ca2+-binding EF-hand superfamily protein